MREKRQVSHAVEFQIIYSDTVFKEVEHSSPIKCGLYTATSFKRGRWAGW